MQIESLKVFAGLVETESFTKAAQINKVTQSAVSQQIASMERNFQTLLVERSKKYFRLTREGQAAYQCAKQISQSFASLQNTMQETKNTISGSIQVATAYSIGLHELPAYVKKFLQTYPTVNVRVEYLHPTKVYKDVLENAADLGLVACPEKRPDLEILPLHKYEMVLICHPQHPWANKASIPVQDLAKQNFVSFDADITIRKAIDKGFNRAGISVEHVMEFDNIETIKRAVEIEAGIAIVPHSTVLQEVADKTLVEVKLEGVDLDCPWAAIYKKNKVLSPAMQQFITLLEEPPPV